MDYPIGEDEMLALLNKGIDEGEKLMAEMKSTKARLALRKVNAKYANLMFQVRRIIGAIKFHREKHTYDIITSMSCRKCKCRCKK